MKENNNLNLTPGIPQQLEIGIEFYIFAIINEIINKTQ